MALPWTSASLSFQDLMVAWFRHRDQHEPAHHLLFGSFYETMPYPEFGFLAVAHALEAYVKAPLSPNEAKRKKFRECINDVIDKFGPAIRRRLCGSQGEFSRRITTTRNYFTHYTASLKRDAYRNADLFHARKRLQLILVLAFLRDLGVSESILREHDRQLPRASFERR